MNQAAPRKPHGPNDKSSTPEERKSDLRRQLIEMIRRNEAARQQKPK
jgi:hypothetical protein